MDESITETTVSHDGTHVELMEVQVTNTIGV